MKFKIKNSRSQTATEFVAMVSFLLFFFAVFFLAIQGNMSTKMRENKDLAIKEIALTAQDELNLALESTDGYYREFKIPQTLNGQEYDINITEGLVYVRTVDNKYAIALPVANVTGDIRKDVNIIKKENGEILLNT